MLKRSIVGQRLGLAPSPKDPVGRPWNCNASAGSSCAEIETPYADLGPFPCSLSSLCLSPLDKNDISSGDRFPSKQPGEIEMNLSKWSQSFCCSQPLLPKPWIMTHAPPAQPRRWSLERMMALHYGSDLLIGCFLVSLAEWLGKNQRNLQNLETLAKRCAKMERPQVRKVRSGGLALGWPFDS